MDAPIKNKPVADEVTKTSSARPLHAPKLATEFEIRDSIAAVRDLIETFLNAGVFADLT